MGLFLAYRQVKRASIATTGLIIFVMMLTFLNLVVVRGVLVGLLQGAMNVYKSNYAGDIIITNLPKKNFIENSSSAIEIIKKMPWVESYTHRYVEGGEIEATYQSRIKETDEKNASANQIAGIDPEREDLATKLSDFVVEGRYLTRDDADGILLGANMLKQYLNVEAPGLLLLESVHIGDKVRVTLNGNRKEFVVIGFLQSKTDQIDFRAFINENTARSLIGREDFNMDEIAIFLKKDIDPYLVKEALLKADVGENARVQTWEESLPKFLLDIRDTFGFLGNAIGSIGLVVASITIFIVVFINAITRKKYIGILKGIGVHSMAIEISYVIQSFLYAFAGVVLGALFLYGFLVPFVDTHPIKFPFSDGVIVAEYLNTGVRAIILLLATLIAGYIPARIVVKGNTLDAILGRK